ncbi:MAG: ABC transporter permease [Chloroflexi bacterium]|nr:ABC transporter permease [Chloroflexota bacterium]
MSLESRVVGEAALQGAAQAKPRSEWSLAWRRLYRNKGALVGGVVLIVMASGAIFADLIASERLDYYNVPGALLPPGTDGHLFGTDDIGRDVFSRVVRGARISLRIGFTAVAIGAFFGSILGLVAGYFGRWPDMLISRVLDVMLAFPSLLLAITIVAGLGPGLNNAMIALGIAGIPGYARVVRGTTLSAREFTYVRAARAVGMRDGRIIFRHILPNVISPILILATLGLGTNMLSAAGLSFLGLGAGPPEPEWGLELSLNRNYFRTAWWIPTFNGLALAITVFAINLFGDGLREALDPQASAWAG